jgi:aspartyl-tRNA(Asn)/glutamyl-tRNA(Gln) amidotransferase subunit C
MPIDADTVRKVANLARIRVEEARLAPMAAELSGIIAWIEQLAEVECEDVVTEGGDAAAILANAPKARDGFFVAPKVVE